MEQQSAAAAEKADRAVKENTGSPAEKKEAKAAEEKTKKRIEKNIEENTEENTQKIRKIESNETEEKNATENVAFLDDKERETKAGSEEAYSQLSEADRRAMEYGYQMQQKDAEKKVRRKKRRKIAKRAGITAAALVAVFGVSMTSDANRRYVLEAWNTVAEKVGMRTGVNYLEEDPIRLGDTEEERAQEDVREKLKIRPVKFDYLPEGWNFSSYEINKEADFGIFFYTNGEHWFSVYMKKNASNNVSYGEEGVIEIVENSQNIKIQLQKTQNENKEMYSASFQEDDASYYCNGDVAYEEMKKVAKYLIILEE